MPLEFRPDIYLRTHQMGEENRQKSQFNVNEALKDVSSIAESFVGPKKERQKKAPELLIKLRENNVPAEDANAAVNEYIRTGNLGINSEKFGKPKERKGVYTYDKATGKFTEHEIPEGVDPEVISFDSRDEKADSIKPPPGYRYKTDGSLEPIPGGPAEAKVQSAKEKEEFALKGMKDQANLVINKVDQALKKVGLNTAGMGGAIMGSVPGSEAKNLESDLDTIKAILGFNTLAEMRKASPTGGALGAISDREIRLLTSTMASLEREQSPKQLAERLGEVKKHYQNWLLTMEGINPDEGENKNSQSGPKVGEVRKGYRFIGGDPADKNSWEKAQ